MPGKRLSVSIALAADVEYLKNRPTPYRARVRWTDPETRRRRSLSTSHNTSNEAEVWANEMRKAAAGGVDPAAATMTLADYGELNMQLALRGPRGQDHRSLPRRLEITRRPRAWPSTNTDDHPWRG